LSVPFAFFFFWVSNNYLNHWTNRLVFMFLSWVVIFVLVGRVFCSTPPNP